MLDLKYLVIRNLRLYLRDKVSIFFSFLSSIILIGIYVLFLGNSILPTDIYQLITKGEAQFLVYGQMLAGIVVLNTINIPLANMGNLIFDFEYKQIDSFVVTPVKRIKIILGYYLSSIIITTVLSIIIWLASVLMIGFVTGNFFSFITILKVSLLIPVFTLVSTAFVVLLITFIKSPNAFGAVSGIVGSVVGFLAGIYMPISSTSPKGLLYISSVLPFSHMTSTLKKVVMNEPLQIVFDKSGGNDEIILGLKDGFGSNSLPLLGLNIDQWIIHVIFGVIAVLLIILSTRRINKRISN